MTSIFLSYARDDDEPFVWKLFECLKEAGFNVWFDRVSMPARQLAFHQEIRDAIASCARLVLIVGPRAIASDYVGQEWRFAYFEALKCVNAIVRLDGMDAAGKSIDAYSLIPEDLRLVHAEDFRGNEDFEYHVSNLIRQLSDPLPRVGKLVAVPELPPHFVQQPDRIKALRNIVLADLIKPVVVSGASARVGVQGMGGIGKSVLASALVHRPDVRRAFPDGIYWVTVGQEPRVEDLQRSLLKELGDESLFIGIESGKQRLREALAQLAVLLVLDDVWHRAHAEAFNVTGPCCRLLLTTRDAGLVTALASRKNHYQVQLLTMAEAEVLLAKAADAEGGLPQEARTVIEECGRLPLALALAGGMVRRHVPWGDVLAALRERDLKFISDRYPLERQHTDIWRAIDASVRVLDANERERFAELAVFMLDAGAPEAAVLTLWQHTASLGARYARELLAEFADRSLIELNESDGRIRLHDLIHNFATGMAEKEFGSIASLHQRLIGAYQKKCPDGWPSGPNDGYLFLNLVYHLILAERVEDAVALLLDFRWLKAKVEPAAINSLQQDFILLLQTSNARVDNETRSALEQLRNFIGPLRSSEQLATAVWGHFAESEHPRVRQLLEQARSLTSKPWLRPITPSLANPNPGLIQAISFRDQEKVIESLAVGDTVNGHTIVVAIKERPPKHLYIWIDGTAMPVVPIPDLVKTALPFLSEILSIRAVNLPLDSRPALLLSWAEASHGNCCCVWDLSRATYDIADYLVASLDCLQADHRHPLALGPVMALGRGEPISLANIAGRLVLLVYEPSRGRASVRDVEIGGLVPRIGWSLRGIRPVLIGEDYNGRPFLIHTLERQADLFLTRLGAKSSIELTQSFHLREQFALSCRNDRPVIVKGGLEGLEVVDATNGEVVGRFMKHLDNERLLAAGIGEDGAHLVASVGDLGTRGRFSTSVRVWNVETQKQIYPTGESHTGRIWAIASGRYRGAPVFATADSDLICLWSTRSEPGYSPETEPKWISNPNICGRVSAIELPKEYRHHDLGAVRPLLSPPWGGLDLRDSVITWAARRSDIESLVARQQNWNLQPLERGEFRRGVASSDPGPPLMLSPDAAIHPEIETHHTDKIANDVVSVCVFGQGEHARTIETVRRDGTRRMWKFSLRADWERQRGTWQYWHCVSVTGAVSAGTGVSIEVDPIRGGVIVKYKCGRNWSELEFDPGCPATQCALGEDGVLVIFDERSTVHYLELVIPRPSGKARAPDVKPEIRFKQTKNV